jgi:hypothetical protein
VVVVGDLDEGLQAAAARLRLLAGALGHLAGHRRGRGWRLGAHEAGAGGGGGVR